MNKNLLKLRDALLSEADGVTLNLDKWSDCALGYYCLNQMGTLEMEMLNGDVVGVYHRGKHNLNKGWWAIMKEFDISYGWAEHLFWTPNQGMRKAKEVGRRIASIIERIESGEPPPESELPRALERRHEPRD